MSLSNPNAHLLGDALSDEAREERRNLLLASTVGMIVERAGLIPSKIETLGIEFPPVNQSLLLWIIAIIVFYFLCGFFLYGLADFVAWRIMFRETLEKHLSECMTEIKAKGAQSLLKETSPENVMRLLKTVRPLSWIRAVFDFGLPLLIGIVAIFFLVRQAVRLMPETVPAVTLLI